MSYIKRYVIDIFSGEDIIEELEDENGRWCKADDVKELESIIAKLEAKLLNREKLNE